MCKQNKCVMSSGGREALIKAGKTIGNALFNQNHNLNVEVLLLTAEQYEKERHFPENISSKQIVIIPEWVIQAIQAGRIK